MADWYLGSTKHTAIAQWAASTSYTLGDIVRQLAAPSLNDERAFRAENSGTSSGSEPSWNLTQSATTTDNDITWREVTGNSTYGWNAAAARARLFCQAGSSWAAAGDTVYRSDNHAETQAGNLTLDSPGTAASPLRILTVVDSAAPPTALATTASISTTGGPTMAFSGFAWDYGCTYNSGDSGTANFQINVLTPYYWRFEAGEIVFAEGGGIIFGGNFGGLDDRMCEFINQDISFGNATTGSIDISTRFNWIGGTLNGTAVSHLIGNVSNGPGGIANINGVDLSILNSGENLVAAEQNQVIEINFENCKLGASVAVANGTITGQGGTIVRMVNCDSADTNNRYFYKDYMGTAESETVVVLNVTRKIITSANTQIYKPFILDPIILYNKDLTSQTATIEIVNDGLTLQDDEIWLEVEYLGTSGFPLSLFSNDRIVDPIFGTPANQTTSSAAWTTTGLTTPIKQKLEVTFTALEEGVLKLRVYVARPSTTVYADLQSVLS